MSTVSSIFVDIVRGLPSLLKPRVEVWEVPGLDTYGAQTLGLGDSEFELETVWYSYLGGVFGGGTPAADADAHLNACIALQGTVISYVDDWGAQYNNVLVLHVDVAADAKKPVNYRGSNVAVRVCVRWKMLSV